MKRFSFFRSMPVYFAMAVVFSVTGCNKKASSITPALPGNEFLTTVQLRLVNSADASDVQTASWTQMSPYTHVFQTDSAYFSRALLNLRANATYNGQVIILDETQTPVDTVSAEISQRANYHLFFFQPSPVLSSNIVISNTSTDIPQTDWLVNVPDTTAGGVSDDEVAITSGNPLNLTVTRLDEDGNTPPLQVGLLDKFVTGPASNGVLRVVLRHQPNAKNGTYDPGSTDLDVTYAVYIK